MWWSKKKTLMIKKNIKINDLKLRGTACGGEISSRIFHDQIWIEKFLTMLRRRNANKKCPWSNKNRKILDRKIGWISENCEVVCLFGCGVSLSKGPYQPAQRHRLRQANACKKIAVIKQELKNSYQQDLLNVWKFWNGLFGLQFVDGHRGIGKVNSETKVKN